jgi:hypothetical protein
MILDKVPCADCGEPLIPAGGAIVHPGCAVPGMSPENPDAEALKQQLVSMVRWSDANSARSLQGEIGPSEIATSCDRRLGYRLAQIPRVNTFFDPWPATVGTAVHRWLDESMQRWYTHHGDQDWITEEPLTINGHIPGRSDLYHNGMVIDYKTANTQKMKQISELGASCVPEYVTQVQLYGKGFEQAGYPVHKVSLVFFPRAGWLRDTQVWVGDYDRSVADAALDRMYGIAQLLVDLDVISNPHRWEQVPCTPTNACGWCPMYAPDKILETGADDTGCPGR